MVGLPTASCTWVPLASIRTPDRQRQGRPGYPAPTTPQGRPAPCPADGATAEAARAPPAPRAAVTRVLRVAGGMSDRSFTTLRRSSQASDRRFGRAPGVPATMTPCVSEAASAGQCSSSGTPRRCSRQGSCARASLEVWEIITIPRSHKAFCGVAALLGTRCLE